MYSCWVVLFALVFILLSSHLFCNALEHLGESLGITDGVTGSILAAVATAMPETIIPILAVLTHDSTGANHGISLGAILGAPLMLSTLSLFIMAVVVMFKRGINGVVAPEVTGVRRDIKFFLFGYLIAVASAYTKHFAYYRLIAVVVVVLLIVSYLLYLYTTLKAAKQLPMTDHATISTSKLFLQFFIPKKIAIGAQLILSILMLIYFAQVFINAINGVALLYGVSAFILALVIVPVATELPEKLNSIIWLFNKKDTLAIGNITGALVFQGTLLPIVALVSDNWQITDACQSVSIVITILATGWLYFSLRSGKIKLWAFAINGILYASNLYLLKIFA